MQAAARGLSRSGYRNLALERVAQDAGYSRGAIYHQFESKERLALAVVEWVHGRWISDVGDPASREENPVAELLAMARGHAIFCRRDIARVIMTLRVEFAGEDHPVGRAIDRIAASGITRVARLVEKGRAQGSIPPGPPPPAVASAVMSGLEGAVIGLEGQEPFDAILAVRVVAGALGVSPPPGFEEPELG